MDAVPYEFCTRLAECSLVDDRCFEDFNGINKWRNATEDSQLKIKIQLACLDSGIWKYSIRDKKKKTVTIQELTKKPNFKEYRVEKLEIHTELENTFPWPWKYELNAKDLAALDRPLSAFLDVLSFLSNEPSLQINAPTPLNPEDEVTIVERLEKLRFHDIKISTFTPVYHNLVTSYLSGSDSALRRPDRSLGLNSNEWPEETQAMLQNSVLSGKLRRVNLGNNSPWSFEFFEHLFKTIEADIDSFIQTGFWFNAVFDENIGEELEHFREEIMRFRRDSVDEKLGTWRWRLRSTEIDDFDLELKLGRSACHISSNYYNYSEEDTDDEGDYDVGND